MEVLDRLIGAVRRCCEGFPDPRTGHNGSYAMADFGLAAFSVFFAQSPSFLAHQRQLAAGPGRPNATPPFGMSRIPGDSHIRRMLDPVAPDHLFPVFDEVISDLERAGGLAAFQRLGSRASAWARAPAPGLARADRAGWHRVPPLDPGPLPALLDPHPC